METNNCTWTAIGDSFTSGTGDAPASGGWVARSAQLLNEDGFTTELTNLAVHGAPIGDVLASQVPQVARRRSIVSAIAGANDLLRIRFRAEELEDNVRQMIAHALRCGETVLTSTCPDFFQQRFGSNSRLSYRVEILNDMIRDATAPHTDRIVVLDTWSILQSQSLWHEDGVHPNAAGHQRLAEEAVTLLKAELVKNEPLVLSS